MNGQEGAVDAEDWYDQDDIPTSIRYNLWFGYVYLTQQDDPLLEKWSILASEKADVHPLYPHQANDTQRAQYISLMEHHQEVYRARNPEWSCDWCGIVPGCIDWPPASHPVC
jgi:hypothetical protein